MGKTKLLSLVTAVCVCMGFCGCAEKTADTIRPDSREVTGNFTVTCMKSRCFYIVHRKYYYGN